MEVLCRRLPEERRVALDIHWAKSDPVFFASHINGALVCMDPRGD